MGEAWVDRLVSADGCRDVAAALLQVVDEGLCAAAQVYRLDAARGLLIEIGTRGNALGDVHPAIPRGDHPLWRALDGGDTVPFAGPTGPCRAFALAGPSELCGGIVVALAPGADLPAAFARRLDLGGRALARALRTDQDRWDARMLRELLPVIDDGVMLVTTDGEVVHYSDPMRRIVGWSADEVRAHGWTNLVYATDAERLAAKQAIAALVLGQPSQGTRRPLTHRSGQRFTAGVWSRVVPHPAGGAPGLLGVIRDVTAADEARQKAAREESLVQLGRLARGIAHDFNNLLCAIGGHAELIDVRTDDPALKASARTQLDATDKGARLARQLLAFGGPSSTRSAPHRAGALLDSAVDLYRGSAPRGVRVEGTVLEDGVIDVDPGQIHQALLNLLTNAGQALVDHGAIKARVDRAPLPADVTWRAPTAPPTGTRMVRFKVQDDGPGFPAVDLQRLFEPFFTTNPHGHGVGLAAVQGVVANHHGAVRLSNAGGARIELFFPASDRPEMKYDELRRSRGQASGRVWVLDDQVQILEFTRISLSAWGFDVHEFSTGADLRRAAESTPADQRPDALVLDVVMPDGGGSAVLPELRALGFTAKVLWVSGFTPESASESLREGAFLQKPYTGGDLAQALLTLLGQN